MFADGLRGPDNGSQGLVESSSVARTLRAGPGPTVAQMRWLRSGRWKFDIRAVCAALPTEHRQQEFSAMIVSFPSS